jgi:anti-anti-sigma regulatory factor
MTLRIQRAAEGEFVVFTLSGRIKLDQMEELQEQFKSGSADHNIVLDLKEVKLIDREAVRFLAHREAQGTRLRNCPAYIREWISRERDTR